MFGMRGLYSIVLGAGAETDDTKMMQAQMGMAGGGQPGQQPDMNKIYAAEMENMQIIEHKWALDGAEERLLRPPGLKLEPLTEEAVKTAGGAAGSAVLKRYQFTRHLESKSAYSTDMRSSANGKVIVAHVPKDARV